MKTVKIMSIIQLVMITSFFITLMEDNDILYSRYETAVGLFTATFFYTVAYSIVALVHSTRKKVSDNLVFPTVNINNVNQKLDNGDQSDINGLRNLKKLLENGLISPEEFEGQKKQILNYKNG